VAEKIFIGNFPKGLTQNPLPFNIDNDAFPYMLNFYTWRGRAKRKRGTILLGRLALFFSSTAAGTVDLAATPTTYNLFSHITAYSDTSGPITIAIAEPGANFIPGSASAPLVLTIGTQTLTDSTGTGAFVVTGGPGAIISATLNYATGVLTLILGATPGNETVTIVSGGYYPSLPVMGLEDFIPVVNPMAETISSPYPQLLAFDTKYSYQNFNVASLPTTTFFDVNYYKNPTPAPTDYTGYVPKTTQTPFVWTASDHHQFWTTNFEQALWATNGTPGMQIQAITTWVSTTATTITITVTGTPAVIGDFVFVNEITGTDNQTINGQSGYVTAVSGTELTITFPYAAIATETYTGGIIQYLTNIVPTSTSPSMGDGIKWYDGDPTNATGLPSNSSAGWVNFAPPLSATSVTIDNYTSGNGKPYYLVGAKAIFAYKDRLIFFGCYIATSAQAIAGTPAIYLQDTIIWSWNGAPYYTSSFDGTVTPAAKIVYNPILTAGLGEAFVTREGGALIAYYVDQNGLGGWLAAGIQQQLVSVGINEDVLLVGFTSRQTRLVYTSNDLQPFLFYTINSELGASATFSGITLDRGVITFGTYGFALTTQTGAQRIDLQIPDEAFQIRSTNFGVQRINSARDFYKEWLYFSYCPQSLENNEAQTVNPTFPTQTFFYNYREETWGIFYENYTAHGSFWRYASVTWGTLPYQTWTEWQSWDSSETQALFPTVVAGTPQGFVVVKGEGTGESPSRYISNAVSYSSSPSETQITSYNHCLASGDYIYIMGGLGSINLNNLVGQVQTIIDINNFTVDIPFQWSITGITQATSAIVTLKITPYSQHNFVVGEFVTFSGIVGMTELNGMTYQVTAITSSTITININSMGFTAYVSGGIASATPYQGLGTFSLLSQPLIQSKQFPPSWGQGRQVRMGAQQYLMDTTDVGQVTLNIYLSMNPDDAWNMSTQVTDPNDQNDAILYSTVLFTCPESANIGLTPANTNLQMPTASRQRQIWHRMNTSLIGDTVQFGITLNDAQMRNYVNAISEITLHAAVLDVYPGGPYLS
jgi:hypothetical protein